MKLRDTLNTKEGYQEIIGKKSNFIKEDLIDIEELQKDEKNGTQKYPKPNKEIIEKTKTSILTEYREILEAKYSMGVDLSELKKHFKEVITFINSSRTSSGYANVLRLLSMGIMLNASKEDFDELIKLTERYIEYSKEDDYLIDFIIKSREKNWKQCNNFVIKKPYKYLKDVIDLSKTSKLASSERLKQYIAKEWFKNLIEVKTHLSKWNIHTGYWSWEAGAIAKILELDDSSLIDQPYYPYDMVHYKDA